jgi:hypothetical protein
MGHDMWIKMTRVGAYKCSGVIALALGIGAKAVLPSVTKHSRLGTQSELLQQLESTFNML